MSPAGPQPLACPLEDCHRPPWNGVVGEYCKGHKTYFDNQNGTAGPGIVQADDPELLEKAAKVAAAQEEKELAERRRVKEWETLENGIRRPVSYYSEEELAEIDAEAERNVATMTANMGVRVDGGRVPVTREMLEDVAAISNAMAQQAPPEDPVRDGAKFFKQCLRGKKGTLARTLAWSTLNTLGDIAE